MQASPFGAALPVFPDVCAPVPFRNASPGPQEAGPGAQPGPIPFDIATLLARITLLAPPPAAAPLDGGPRTIADSSQHLANWVQPSGPRCKGQGVEDVEQGVVLAEPTHTGGALLRITLLAAGFIIGPAGSSVRDVCALTGTDIKSWTADPEATCPRSSRVFRVEGPRAGVVQAVGILCDAVERYKELCEGRYTGQTVARVQQVGGVDFAYQPPPRSIVPYAASLKGQSGSRRGSGGGNAGSGRPATGGNANGRPPPAPRSQQGAKAGSSLARTASLGPTSPSGPSRPTVTVTLKRSSSLPQQAPQRAASGSVSATSSTGTVGSPGSSASTSTSLLNPSAAGYEPCCCGSHRGAGGSSGRSIVSEEEARRAACDSPTNTSACPSGGGGGGPSEACGEQQGRRVAPPPAGCEGLQQQHPQPAEKLAKDDVMHSLFGGEECAEAGRQQPVAPISAAGHHAPPQFGSAQITRLLQQLALQDAQQQAAVVNAALAGQQHSGPRGEAFSQGPPSLLSPWDQLPAFMGCPPASHASLLQQPQQGCAFNADALGAMIAACQTGALAQAAVSEQLLQLHASGLLAPPPLPPPHANGFSSAGSGGSPTFHGQGCSAAELPGERGPGPAVGWAGGTPVSMSGGMAQSPLLEQQHLPLPSLQPSVATPFGSIGSFRGSAATTPSHSRSPTPAPTPSTSYASWAAGLNGSNSGGSTAGQPQLTPHALVPNHLHNSRAVSCQNDNGSRNGSDSRSCVAPNRQPTFIDSEQAVAPPRTALPNGAAVMPAPPALNSATSAAAATAGAGIDGGGGGLHSSAAFQFAAEPRGHSHDRALNPSALPFDASLASSQSAHKGAPAAVVEQAGQEHGDYVSSYTSSMLQPTSDAPLARASSLPGSNGESTQQLGHLSDLLSLARSNSFRANPPFPPPNAPAQDPPTAHPADYPSSFQSEATEQLHRALLAAATSGPQCTPAGASQFASAFSPRSAASLAPPPPPPGRMAAPQLGTRCSSAPRDQFARRVDHMIDSMFHRQ